MEYAETKFQFSIYLKFDITKYLIGFEQSLAFYEKNSRLKHNLLIINICFIYPVNMVDNDDRKKERVGGEGKEERGMK